MLACVKGNACAALAAALGTWQRPISPCKVLSLVRVSCNFRRGHGGNCSVVLERSFPSGVPLEHVSAFTCTYRSLGLNVRSSKLPFPLLLPCSPCTSKGLQCKCKALFASFTCPVPAGEEFSLSDLRNQEHCGSVHRQELMRGADNFLCQP